MHLAVAVRRRINAFSVSLPQHLLKKREYFAKRCNQFTTVMLSRSEGCLGFRNRTFLFFSVSPFGFPLVPDKPLQWMQDVKETGNVE